MIKYTKLFFLGLWFLVCLITGLLRCFAFPFSSSNNYFFMQIFSRVACLILGLRVEIKGKENLIPNQQYVFVMNHQSNFDVVLGSCLKLKNTIALGKFEILFFPIFGLFFYLAGNVLVKRKKRKSIARSVRKIDKMIQEKKQSVMIMPEGTRSHRYEMGPFKLGAFRIAIRNKVPILPIVVSSWHEEVNLNRFSSGIIYIEFLSMVTSDGHDSLSANNMAKIVRSRMEQAQ